MNIWYASTIARECERYVALYTSIHLDTFGHLNSHEFQRSEHLQDKVGLCQYSPSGMPRMEPCKLPISKRISSTNFAVDDFCSTQSAIWTVSPSCPSLKGPLPFVCSNFWTWSYHVISPSIFILMCICFGILILRYRPFPSRLNQSQSQSIVSSRFLECIGNHIVVLRCLAPQA